MGGIIYVFELLGIVVVVVVLVVDVPLTVDVPFTVDVLLFLASDMAPALLLPRIRKNAPSTKTSTKKINQYPGKQQIVASSTLFPLLF